MSVQSSLVMYPIYQYGTQLQKEKYIPKLGMLCLTFFLFCLLSQRCVYFSLLFSHLPHLPHLPSLSSAFLLPLLLSFSFSFSPLLHLTTPFLLHPLSLLHLTQLSIISSFPPLSLSLPPPSISLTRSLLTLFSPPMHSSRRTDWLFRPNGA